MNEAGDLFAYSGTIRKPDPSPQPIDYSARGFPLTFGKGANPPATAGGSASATITLLKKQDNGQFTSERLYPDHANLCRGIPAFSSVYTLSLSPNGRYLRPRNEKTWIRPTETAGPYFSLLSEFLQKLLASRNRIDRSVQTT